MSHIREWHIARVIQDTWENIVRPRYHSAMYQVLVHLTQPASVGTESSRASVQEGIKGSFVRKNVKIAKTRTTYGVRKIRVTMEEDVSPSERRYVAYASMDFKDLDVILKSITALNTHAVNTAIAYPRETDSSAFATRDFTGISAKKMWMSVNILSTFARTRLNVLT